MNEVCPNCDPASWARGLLVAVCFHGLSHNMSYTCPGAGPVTTVVAFDVSVATSVMSGYILNLDGNPFPFFVSVPTFQNIMLFVR